MCVIRFNFEKHSAKCIPSSILIIKPRNQFRPCANAIWYQIAFKLKNSLLQWLHLRIAKKLVITETSELKFLKLWTKNTPCHSLSRHLLCPSDIQCKEDTVYRAHSIFLKLPQGNPPILWRTAVDLKVFLLDPDSRIHDLDLRHRIQEANYLRIQPEPDPDPTWTFLWQIKKYVVK